MRVNALRSYHGIDGCGSRARCEMACFEAEAVPLYATLFMVMELLPRGIVAGGRRAHSAVEVHFKAEVLGIS